jgi:hypothetical protein
LYFLLIISSNNSDSSEGEDEIKTEVKMEKVEENSEMQTQNQNTSHEESEIRSPSKEEQHQTPPKIKQEVEDRELMPPPSTPVQRQKSEPPVMFLIDEIPGYVLVTRNLMDFQFV